MSAPIISVAQMRDWEAATWASGQTEAEVIRQVGHRVGQCALELTCPNDFILLLAGTGHNGDDVRAAEPVLKGRLVELLSIESPAASFAALGAALDRKPALVVDGLFGIGLNRSLDEHWIKLIERINQTKIPVLSVDVPSGLNADTGEHFGTVIHAATTLTVGAPKRGLLQHPAWPSVGRLEVATDVGLIAYPNPAEVYWSLPENFSNFPPRRSVAAHKSAFGHLAIIAGSLGYHGAAVLATRGAQRAQPGLVTTFTLESSYLPIASQLQSAMVNLWTPEVYFPGDFTAVLVGPGLAARDVPEELLMFVRKMWRDSLLPMIVDASALDWLPMSRVPRGAIRVVTPHPGEAARLLKTNPAHIQADRARSLRDISKHLGNCWVVLKGHHTLIGHEEGELFINPSGNPHLAQGGSGDVLAGFIAGLMAQPGHQDNVGAALRYAVWQHGATADALQARQRNWTIEDLANEIGNLSPQRKNHGDAGHFA